MLIDEEKDIVVRYKNIYDYKKNRQAWKEYNEKLHKLERENRIFNNNFDFEDVNEEYIIDYKDEEEYWNEQMKEWKDMI